MKQPRIGLLPLYVKLYDDTLPQLRSGIERFYKDIAKQLETRGLGVVCSDICRLQGEVKAAVNSFEQQKVDALVTLHLAYSPSLEAAPVLAKTELPILVLDTTPDYSFNGITGAGKMMQNHGIHGVQDMCSVLRRNGVNYHVFAGHWEHSDVLDRVAAAAKGAMMAKAMQGCRVGRVGEPFVGMGDFSQSDQEIASLGVELVRYNLQQAANRIEAVTEDDIRSEWEKDSARFIVEGVSYEAYARCTRVDLAFRQWVDNEKLDAVAVNFLATESNPGLPSMPFVELCKCMERGIGYAGEGDTLTAAFTYALMQGFAHCTFAEMFCPDWEGNSVYCSHMGEYNIALTAGKPVLTQMKFGYTNASDPTVLYGCMMGGEGTAFVNLNPIGNGRYTLIAGVGKMLDIPRTDPELTRSVRGWFQPGVPLEDFLARYSRVGGGHHGAIIYDVNLVSLELFAHVMGWEYVLID